MENPREAAAAAFSIAGGQCAQFMPHVRREDLVGRLLLVIGKGADEIGKGGLDRAGAFEARREPFLL